MGLMEGISEKGKSSKHKGLWLTWQQVPAWLSFQPKEAVECAFGLFKKGPQGLESCLST